MMGFLGADNIIFLHLNVGYGGDGGGGWRYSFCRSSSSFALIFLKIEYINQDACLRTSS